MIDIDVDQTWIAVIRAAVAYRKAEQDGTPRCWRGKELHDLAMHLDKQIDALKEECGEELWSEFIDM